MSGYTKIKLDKLDTEWGKLVRLRDGRCLYCGATNNLAAHHIFGRGRSGTRYVLDNGITLCPSHHVFNDTFSAHKTPEKFKRWVKKFIGVGLYKHLEKLSLSGVTRERARKEFTELLVEQRQEVLGA